MDVAYKIIKVDGECEGAGPRTDGHPMVVCVGGRVVRIAEGGREKEWKGGREEEGGRGRSMDNPERKW